MPSIVSGHLCQEYFKKKLAKKEELEKFNVLLKDKRKEKKMRKQKKGTFSSVRKTLKRVCLILTIVLIQMWMVFLLTVKDYVKQNNLKTPFNDGTPGKDWFSSFKKRYNLSIKKPQAVEVARKKAADPFVIQEFYDILDGVIADLGLQDKPERIYNFDETSYCSDPQKTKVIGLRGFPSTRTTSSSGKSNMTVLMASNAAGDKGAPLIIFKGKHVWSNWISNLAYPGTLYTATSNGWIKSRAFFEYIDKSFIPMIGDTTQPTLLIYDGHSTHVQIAVIEKALQHNITNIKLPPHTSHILQPLNLAVFKPFKDAWDQEMVKWQRTHNGQKLPKADFSRIVGKVWEAFNPDIIKMDLKKVGLPI
ncbi:unnamed protein product [Pieris brassicae]|uniref:DDE-1 domain-containing protein n=1 Tax=Pieris brassicae TaxID=7116 RepID=A0A9P0TKG9_PIEBR|nr:unnamed protein product [Pieris brassicae]